MLQSPIGRRRKWLNGAHRRRAQRSRARLLKLHEQAARRAQAEELHAPEALTESAPQPARSHHAQRPVLPDSPPAPTKPPTKPARPGPGADHDAWLDYQARWEAWMIAKARRSLGAASGDHARTGP